LSSKIEVSAGDYSPSAKYIITDVRAAGMGGVSEGEGAGGAGEASRARLEADLASQFGERGGAPAPLDLLGGRRTELSLL